MEKNADNLLKKIARLEKEKKKLFEKLEKAEETIENLSGGKVDALLLENDKSVKLFTTKTADQTYRLFIEKMLEGAVTMNPEGIILYSNMQFSKLIKTPLENIIGSDFHDFIPLHCKKKFERLFNIAWKKDTKGELVITNNEGLEKPVLLSLTSLQLQESNALSIVVTDLTKFKASELELKMRNQQLKAANTELESFAYIASHDLQEPLRTVINYVGLFQKQHNENSDPKSGIYLNFINEATTRMQTLINDLLEYSIIGRHNTGMTAIDCNQLLSTVLKDMSVTILESGTKIKCRNLPVINGYFIEMKSLFQNLISNAIRFKKPNKAPVINISAQAKDKEWLFAVKDNGIGIDKIYHSKIFTIFQRLHTQKEFPGTGIGLAHCKKIVELHKGNIWVESEPGQGSTFYFTIPKTIIK